MSAPGNKPGSASENRSEIHSENVAGTVPWSVSGSASENLSNTLPVAAPPAADTTFHVDLRHQAGTLTLRACFTLNADRAALFGPSGSGKTTLLRILAGLQRPQRGAIRLGDHLLTDTSARIHVPPGARGTGLVTQAPALFPHLSVEANLRFGLRALDRAAQQHRLLELFALLQLEPLRTRMPGALSGGEQQRVALARALAPQPRLLLLDEPFSALDGARKADLWAALDPYLRERNIRTLLVSHDPGEVFASAQTVIRIETGLATQQGPPALILAQERQHTLRQLGAL